LDLAMDILSGPDDLNKKGWKLELPLSNKKSLSEFKVAVWLHTDYGPIDQEVEEKLTEAITLLEQAGVSIDHEVYPDFDPEISRQTYLMLLNGLMAAGYPDKVLKKMDAMAPDIAEDDQSYHALSIKGCNQYHREWLKWNEMRQQLRLKWEIFFQEYDLLLCPVSPTVAYQHNHTPMEKRTIQIKGVSHAYMEQIFWAGIATVASLPTTVAPVGLSSSGLPVGIQIVAPYLEDKSSIRFAQLMEDVVGGFTPPPNFL